MTPKSQTLLAVLIFLSPFFQAFPMLFGPSELAKAGFIIGIILGLLAVFDAIIRVGLLIPRFAFAIGGLLVAVGWLSFLSMEQSSVPFLGFVLVFIGGTLALGSAFWLKSVCPHALVRKQAAASARNKLPARYPAAPEK